MANRGYPGKYEKNSVIRNLEDAEEDANCYVFHAGTARADNGALLAIGGRVLAITALGNDVASARKRAYEGVAKIDWSNGFYRKDIAKT